MSWTIRFCSVCRVDTWHENGVCEWTDSHRPSGRYVPDLQRDAVNPKTGLTELERRARYTCACHGFWKEDCPSEKNKTEVGQRSAPPDAGSPASGDMVDDD